MRRRGISPVVAILVLVMLAVVAVGGLYIWVSTFLESRDDIQRDLNTELELVSTRCVDSGTDDIVFAMLDNTGDTSISARDAEIRVESVADGTLLATVDDVQWDAKAFTEPGNSDTVAVSLNDSFVDAGRKYRLTIQLPTSSVTTWTVCTSVAKETLTSPAARWEYKKPIRITNTGSMLENHSIHLSIDTADLIADSRLQTECEDLRFRTDNGTELAYWVDPQSCDTEETDVWVRMPEIRSGETTIWMYYGNIAVDSASNGEQTFLLFEDFASYDNWQDMQDSGWVKHDTMVELVDDTFGRALKMVPGSDTPWNHYAVTGTIQRQSYVVEALYKTERSADGLVVKWSNQSRWWGAEHHSFAALRGFHSGQFACSSGTAQTEGVWQTHRYAVTNSSVTHWIDDKKRFHLDTCLDGRMLSPPFKVGFNVHNNFGPAYVDNLRVIQPQPSSLQYSVGAEQ